ncbi:MAG: tyrosine-type recombinase/integrase [Anaerolineae bacterium]
MNDDLIAGLPEENSAVLWTGELPFTQHPAVVYLASLSEGSRRTIFQALDTMARLLSGGRLGVFMLNWAALRYEHTAAIRSLLAERYKPATANKMLSALRQVLYHAWQLGQISAEDYQRARSVRSVVGDVLPAGRSLSRGELAALMAACEADPSPTGARDAAIIALMYATGIRRSSVVRLNLSDYDPAIGTLRVQQATRNKEYLAYVAQDGAQRAMADWLAVRGAEAGPLFWPVTKGGDLIPRRLSTQAVYNLLIKRARQAGVRDFSPHDLRRTLASDLLDAGADVVTVQRILGHDRRATAVSPDHPLEEAKRKAATLIHVPYGGRRSEQ